MKQIKLFISNLYMLNHCDTQLYPITLFGRYYKYRTGFKTAWKLTRLTLKQTA